MDFDLKPEALAAVPLPDLMARAAAVRDAHWGKRLTYSRKVFVPLTNMCRDTCGYCVFVQHPELASAKIMTPEEVAKVVREGERLGCKEVLFSLGEKPELRYPAAAKRLAALGYGRMTDYLADMCAWVLDETALIPHVNAGSMAEDEIDMLKPVSGSMGMMVENMSRRFNKPGMAHYACPDKTPTQRLRTLERTGRAKVPFTTGILIGIGETWAERIEALEIIAEVHRRYDHIQEVIVQNFQRKAGIEMENHPEPALDEMLRTLAAARLILPSDVSLQAPPNLSERHGAYIAAGINDWGGVSPLTIDFINPDHAWPEIDTLRSTTEAEGYALEERLTVYPDYLGDGFTEASVAGKLAGMARADGLAAEQVA
ncbi:MAG: 7,8-didemethyl-8-hydroxy-5-deazariboflavin synthase CofG [Pseudomonadota bacterium]